ncbi:GNAT family N-acetyltransferase [Sphingomonas sp. UYP23]
MTGIRIAQPADDDVLAKLLIRSFSHLYAATSVKMTPERERYLNGHACRSPLSTCFIYEHEGVAMGTVTLTPPSSNSEAWISDAWTLGLLAVDPRRHRRGIARELLHEAQLRARASGATVLCLHARRGVPSQARLYLTCGFVHDPAGDLDGKPLQDGYRKTLAP